MQQAGWAGGTLLLWIITGEDQVLRSDRGRMKKSKDGSTWIERVKGGKVVGVTEGDPNGIRHNRGRLHK